MQSIRMRTKESLFKRNWLYGLLGNPKKSVILQLKKVTYVLLYQCMGLLKFKLSGTSSGTILYEVTKQYQEFEANCKGTNKALDDE